MSILGKHRYHFGISDKLLFINTLILGKLTSPTFSNQNKK